MKHSIRGPELRAACTAALILMMLGARIEHAAAQDSEALAERLVQQSANVQKGDNVLVTGTVRDLELLENIAVNVRKVGAFPIVTIESDRMARRLYTDVPAEFDSQSPDFYLKMAEIVDAIISVEGGEAEGLLADIPPDRIAARSEAFQPVNALMMERGVKVVNLGNELYPTEFRAERFGISRDELAKLFWNGVNVDYAKLQAQGNAVRAALAAGNEVHVTNPNGTDLRVRIGDYPVLVSDGAISEEDVAAGGAAVQVWLPAGEVYTAVVPGTAEGTVVVDRQPFQDKTVENLRLTFAGGKLTDMTADAGLEPLKAHYDAAGEGKDQFGFIDIGINPSVTIPPDSRMVGWMAAGMVTVGIGNNAWAGGENRTSFATANHLPGSTLTVDGKVVVQDGVLKVPPM